jgi:hypothetical protein
LLEENAGFYLGHEPYRIDVINFADGVAFSEIWKNRIQAEIAGIPFNIIDRDNLITNKRASGRPQDLADLDKLQKRGPRAP